jgi:WD40 repeat protein
LIHPEGALSVAFSPDGKAVLTGSGGPDGTIRLWDSQTGQERRQFIGHSDQVLALVFSRDGRYVLSGSADGTARLWDAQTGQELRRFTNQAGPIYAAALSPDTRYVLLGDHDVQLLDADYHDTIRTLCRRLPRDFTDDERAQYGISDKTPTCSKN